ncbi:MAG: AraC family transcriptional regulator, partial [Burkholderiales bacterium]|nr:AraC family transcriptional regulator [Burkholderiales bacterium]
MTFKKLQSLESILKNNAPGAVNHFISDEKNPILISHRHSAAHNFVRPECEYVSISLAPHHQVSQLLCNMGDGWKDHFCSDHKPIHVHPPHTACEWKINGSSLVVMFSVPVKTVERKFDEMEFKRNPIDRLWTLVDQGFSEPLVFDMIMRLWSQVRSEGGCTELLVQSYLACILHNLAAANTHQEVRRQDGINRNRIKNLLDWIEDSLHESFDLSSMAAFLQVSDYHFIRLFRKSIGTTPYQYVQNRRIEKARTLLTTTNL